MLAKWVYIFNFVCKKNGKGYLEIEKIKLCNLLYPINKKHLEEILEGVKENLDELDIDEFNKLYNKINELGGFDKWINIPGKNMAVVFKSLDDKTNKLKMIVHKDGGGSEQRVVDNLEDLNLTLYHPELFESVKKTLRKFL